MGRSYSACHNRRKLQSCFCELILTDHYQGYIPGGQPFTIVPPGGTSYQWTPQIEAGTSVIFSMYDAQGRSGTYASTLFKVQITIRGLQAVHPISKSQVHPTTPRAYRLALFTRQHPTHPLHRPHPLRQAAVAAITRQLPSESSAL